MHVSISIYIYMCVCMCIHRYKYAYIHMYVYICIFIYVYLYMQQDNINSYHTISILFYITYLCMYNICLSQTSMTCACRRTFTGVDGRLGCE